MEAPVANRLAEFLNNPYLSRVRRNHGLEHATLTVLSRSYPGRGLTGHSDSAGFWIIGNVPPEAVHSAVQEALARMKAGEVNLAVHPNCGTNFVTSGILAALAAFVAFFGAGRPGVILVCQIKSGWRGFGAQSICWNCFKKLATISATGSSVR